MNDFTSSRLDIKSDASDDSSQGAPSMVEWAINYAQSGIPVFPLNGKKPFENTRGFYEATTDLDQIDAWWMEHPNANIGIRTGTAAGFWVFDVDGDDGRQSLAELQKKHDEVVYSPVISRTGKGHHYLFKMNGRDIGSRVKVLPGLDSRGNGGYIVAPPSIHLEKKTRYYWEGPGPMVVDLPEAPDWLADLFETKEYTSSADRSDFVPQIDCDHPYVRAAVDMEARAVANAAKGGRNAALNNAALSLGTLVGARVLGQSTVEDVLFKAAEASGLVDDDGKKSVMKTIASGLKAGIAKPRDLSEVTTSRDKAKSVYARAAKNDEAKTDSAETDNTSVKDDGASDDPIQLVAGDLDRVVDDAEAALVKTGACVYQRGSMLVTIGQSIIKTRSEDVIGPRIHLLNKAAMVEHMTKAARFSKWDGRSDAWVKTDCPPRIADTYLSRGVWKVRVLSGIIEAPTMRWDGSILSKPGYDEKTGLLLIGTVDMPPIPDHPTKEQAHEALKILNEPIRSFPFVADADRSVALSGMLTVITRRAYKSAPLHGFTAPVAGSGKGKLIDTISMAATGRPAGTLPPGKTEEEMEKRLSSALISGDPLITIDNLDYPLGGELLCQCLTQTSMKIRILGQSLNVEVPNVAAMFATGNNLTVLGDMTRRTLMCRVDPQCERPELREFDFDPVELVSANRGRYIAAALTILRAYVKSGFPNKLRRLGSFEEWSDHVRSALVWLGEADPVDTMESARESDPVLASLRTIMTGWADIIGTQEPVMAQKLAAHANAQVAKKEGSTTQFEYAHEEFREALMVVAGTNGIINTKKLGWWLKAHSGRVVDGLRIMPGYGDTKNGVRYLLEKVKIG